MLLAKVNYLDKYSSKLLHTIMAKSKHTKSSPPLQGWPLWKFKEVETLNLSPSLLLDQMVRHYSRHAEGSDVEAKSYQLQLEIKLSQMKTDIEALKSIVQFPPSINSKHQDSDGEDQNQDPLQLLYSLAQDLHSRDHSKKAIIDKNKLLILDLIRDNQDTLEYLQILNIISLNKDQDLQKDATTDSKDDHDSDTNSVLSFTSERPHQLNKTSTNLGRNTRSSSCSHLPISSIPKQDIQNFFQIERDNKQKELEIQAQQNAAKKDPPYIVSLNPPSNLSPPTGQESNISTYSIQSESNDSDKEYESACQSGNEDDLPLPLPITQVKKKLKELAKQTISPTSIISDSYTKKKSLLEKDFIRFGRKHWNDKDVELFLRIHKGNQKAQQNSLEDTVAQHEKTKSWNFSYVNSLLKSTAQIKLLTQEALQELSTHQSNILEVIDQLKSSHVKYIPFLTLQETYHKIISKKLESIMELNQLQEKDLNITHQDLFDTSLTSLKEDVITSLNLCFKDQLDNINSLLCKTGSHTVSAQRAPEKTTDSTSRPNLKKLIIIPSTASDIEEVQDVLRKEMLKSKERPKILNTKLTKNMNLQIQSSTEDASKLSEVLKEKNDNLTIIDPEERKLKIILLRVPKDISQKDLENELNYHGYFTNNNFTILKSIPTQNKKQLNWVVEAPAKDCRKLHRKRTIRVFIDNIKVEFFIRVIRCTNCQALNDHTTSRCTYKTVCGKCAGYHRTQDCNNSSILCINCRREHLEETKHEAYSINCPVFAQERTDRLNLYYKKSLSTQDNKRYDSVASEYMPRLPTHPPSSPTIIRDRHNNIKEIRTVRYTNRPSTTQDSSAISVPEKVHTNSNIKISNPTYNSRRHNYR